MNYSVPSVPYAAAPSEGSAAGAGSTGGGSALARSVWAAEWNEARVIRSGDDSGLDGPGLTESDLDESRLDGSRLCERYCRSTLRSSTAA